jgi:hypothetical protein
VAAEWTRMLIVAEWREMTEQVEAPQIKPFQLAVLLSDGIM